MARNVLVIAPHADDEVFGCGGTIAKWAEQGAYIQLVVLAIGVFAYDSRRYQACEESARVLGISNITTCYAGKDSLLDTMPERDIVSKLDSILDERPYDYVFIPYPSQHEDHKVTHSASMAALRLGAHAHVPNILMYEYTYPDYADRGGKFYVDITNTYVKKVKALEAYTAWLKQFPHPASIEAVQVLAEMRGLAIETYYAEMFHVVQMIGD